MRLRARYVLAGGLELVADGVVEVDDGGVVVGVGRYTGGVAADLGNVVLMPQLVNGHVHVLDAAILDRDDMYIDDLVGWPHGVKYHVVRRLVERGRHTALLEKVARRMRRYGVGCALVYAEYAAGDVEAALRRWGIEAVVFQEAHGGFPSYPNVQVATPVDHPPEYLRQLRARYRLVSTHVSETEDCHEAGDLELALKVLDADVLVHLVHLTPEEVGQIPPSKTVVVNPRANAYFVGRVAPVPQLLHLKPLLGTDNVFMNEPDPWAEMRFLHAYAAAAGWRLEEREILSMATVWGWEKMRCVPPIEPGHRLRAIAVAAPYAGEKVLKFLVKRAAHTDLVAFVEGSSIEPPPS
ncbi:amidohydrolase family protein [Pyrobaculum neutrophilum]|uniref:Amidohydrolase n=1 Tax=Pyrobaculum neutrophilum (strain DSM 2338 / JCM 9278 / NBRC 100436 / V24Sta) TaxID=444157 RepID=B1YDW8_PYRNV|nr:amidohydrolase family protein [Pyrobaculum neutrophilum]ACB39981.1 amidohydrolase [Pyrobaculum neutrophilum V24Sta]